MANLHKISDGVFTSDHPIVQIGSEEIAYLKAQALHTARSRARICAHKDTSDALHEMIIVMSGATYIHPHKHVGKSESFHVIEGDVDIVVFDEEGNVDDVIELHAPREAGNFFYRMPEGIFHTVLIRSEFLVVHEVTNGPFAREQTVLAPFAPPEDDAEAARRYMQELAWSLANRRRY